MVTSSAREISWDPWNEGGSETNEHPRSHYYSVSLSLYCTLTLKLEQKQLKEAKGTPQKETSTLLEIQLVVDLEGANLDPGAKRPVARIVHLGGQAQLLLLLGLLTRLPLEHPCYLE